MVQTIAAFAFGGIHRYFGSRGFLLLMVSNVKLRLDDSARAKADKTAPGNSINSEEVEYWAVDPTVCIGVSPEQVPGCSVHDRRKEVSGALVIS